MEKWIIREKNELIKIGSGILDPNPNVQTDIKFSVLLHHYVSERCYKNEIGR